MSAYRSAVTRFLASLRALIDPDQRSDHERFRNFDVVTERNCEKLLDGLDLSTLPRPTRDELRGRVFRELWSVGSAMRFLVRDVAIDLDESPEEVLQRIEIHLADEESSLDEHAHYMEHHEE